MLTIRKATEVVASAAGLYRELFVSSLQIVPQLRQLARYESLAHAPDLDARIGVSAPSASGSV